MNTVKIGMLFGAGAEISYGLPSGGRFALEIFKMDATEDKQKFREMLKRVNTRSPYATKWLPEDFQKKPISTFGRAQLFPARPSFRSSQQLCSTLRQNIMPDGAIRHSA